MPARSSDHPSAPHSSVFAYMTVKKGTDWRWAEPDSGSRVSITPFHSAFGTRTRNQRGLTDPANDRTDEPTVSTSVRPSVAPPPLLPQAFRARVHVCRGPAAQAAAPRHLCHFNSNIALPFAKVAKFTCAKKFIIRRGDIPYFNGEGGGLHAVSQLGAKVGEASCGGVGKKMM